MGLRITCIIIFQSIGKYFQEVHTRLSYVLYSHLYVTKSKYFFQLSRSQSDRAMDVTVLYYIIFKQDMTIYCAMARLGNFFQPNTSMLTFHINRFLSFDVCFLISIPFGPPV